MDRQPNHLTAILQALFVTFLWSTSWVLIKHGLQDLPALTFAGLRYALAALVLWALLLVDHRKRAALRELPRATWLKLLGLGVVMYALTQGAQFMALAGLPAQTVTLTLSLTPLLVAFFGTFVLSEPLTPRQWSGVALVAAGVALYFLPLAGLTGTITGWIAVAVGLISNAGSSLYGRSVNRGGQLDPLVVTSVSMGFGAILLLTAGAATQGLPPLSLQSWGIVAWLALVNTAFAFTLWNVTLRRLTAVESSLINNTMLVQIAVLAYLFLGEPLGWKQVCAFALVLIGTVVVQLKRRPSNPTPAPTSRA